MRKDEAMDHFDLLPFIAILMCVLGCLLLVTVCVASISLGGAGEAWIPSTDAVAKTKKSPVLVEFDGAHAVFQLDSGRKEVPWSRSDSGEIQPLVDELAELKTTRYALIAVRPSGFDDLFVFLKEFRRRNVTVGYEPIDQLRAVSIAAPKTEPLPSQNERPSVPEKAP